LDGDAALSLLASADVLACTSLSEGGANVVSEALAIGVPVIGTRIGGNVGLLGEDHPGLFPVGDETAMAALLTRLETDPAALEVLAAKTARQAGLVAPETERAALGDLINRVTARA
jgi:glycosyltransferase involved in cell wall biosynthesis